MLKNSINVIASIRPFVNERGLQSTWQFYAPTNKPTREKGTINSGWHRQTSSFIDLPNWNKPHHDIPGASSSLICVTSTIKTEAITTAHSGTAVCCSFRVSCHVETPKFRRMQFRFLRARTLELAHMVHGNKVLLHVKSILDWSQYLSAPLPYYQLLRSVWL